MHNIVLFPPHQRRELAHVGKRQALLLHHEHARALSLDLGAQDRFHGRGRGEVRLHVGRAHAAQPLQNKHGDAVARHRYGKYMQYTHQSFASSAVVVVSYLPVFCAS